MKHLLCSHNNGHGIALLQFFVKQNNTFGRSMKIFRIIALALTVNLVLFQLSGFSQGDEYEEAITIADQYMQQKDYINAKVSYEYASRLNPDASYPKEKLEELMGLLKGQMLIQEEYGISIDQADGFFEQGLYSEAILSYRKALELFPEDQYAKDKIALAENEIVLNQEKENQFNEALLRGNQSYSEKSFDEALKFYQTAASIYPEDEDIEEKIKQTKQAISDMEKSITTFNQFVSEGDRFYELKYYRQAKEKYEHALEIVPEDPVILLRMEEMKEKIESQEAYELLIGLADELYINKDFTTATLKYQEAQRMMPDETYPQSMLDKIALMEPGQNGQGNSYAKIINKADQYFATRQYDLAKVEYEKAQLLKPDEQYPSDQIKEINRIVSSQQFIKEPYEEAIAEADQLYAEENYQGAINAYRSAADMKPTEQYPMTKIKEIEKFLEDREMLESQYNTTITNADKYYENKNYQLALTLYQDALSYLPHATYPTEMITEINQMLVLQEQQENAYQSAIQSADSLFELTRYEQAVGFYSEASTIKPKEFYPKEKIAQIQQMISDFEINQSAYQESVKRADDLFDMESWLESKQAYQDALLIKPAEEYPQSRIDEINTILEDIQGQIELNYQDAIAKGDQLLNADQLSDALIKFEMALNLKPDEIYPKNKIEEIQHLMETRELTQKEYEQYILTADNQFAVGDYTAAREQYVLASMLKPKEDYPKQKKEEIDQILSEQQNEIDQAYQSLIKQGDEYLGLKEFDEAISAYSEALNLKPQEFYPKEKIAEAGDLKKNWETLQSNYQSYILKGDDYYNSRSYEKAKIEYTEALKLIPGEDHPTRRIAEIDRLLDDALRELQESYNQVIAEADKYYNSNAYGQAIEAYKQANTILPEEQYPLEKIAAIQQYLKENAVRDLVMEPTAINEKNQTKFTFEPVSVTDRKKSFIHLKLKNKAEVVIKPMISYGKGQNKNGGFVVDLEPSAEEYEFIIPVGNQYKWFTESNDWISIYNEGGGLEVTLLQISKGK